MPPQNIQLPVSSSLPELGHIVLLASVMMAVARNVSDGCSSIKAGKWERGRLVGVEAKGKTLAIVGLGKGEAYGYQIEA